MRKDSFEFQFKWCATLMKCPAEIRLEVFDAIMSYALNGTHNAITPMAQFVFSSIQEEIDKGRKAYEAIVEKRRNAINLRWQREKAGPTDTNVYKCIQMNTNEYTCINQEESNKENFPPNPLIKEINKEEDNIYNNINNLFTRNIIKEKKETKKKKVFNEFEQQFEDFRKHYPGIKRGFQIEFDNFKKKHPNWKEILPLLIPAVDRLIAYREQCRARGQFAAEYPHLQTWLNQSRWEIEYPDVTQQQTTTHYGTSADIEYERRQAEFRDYITQKLATPYVEPDISEFY